MSRKVVPLTSERLDLLPDRCRQCLFWELGAPRPTDAVASGGPHDATGDELAADPLVQKEAWVASVVLDGGAPGRVLMVDDHGQRRPAGYVAFGPSSAYARRRPPVPAPSDDALLLATAWVEPEARGAGVGRVLVQAALREAIHRDLRAVEAYGDRRHREGACVLACTWLLHEGFHVHREHPRYPLLRIDVKSALRWAESLEEAFEQVLGRLARRAPVPDRGDASTARTIDHGP